MATFTAYKREDDRIGIRNHVLILSTMTYSNTVTRNISNAVEDVIPSYNQYGRALIGKDGEIQERTLAGLGKNPNVGGVLVTGYEETLLNRVTNSIQETGKPVEKVKVEGQGTPQATREGIRKALDLKKQVSTTAKVEADIGDLLVGAECGGSDTTSGIVSNPSTGRAVDKVVEAGGRAMFSETSEILGAEKALIDRAASDDVANDIKALVNYVDSRAKEIGVNLNESNPAPDNIEGGLTTIEEKSIGAILKSGTKPIRGVLDYAEAPSSKGLYFMDTPAPAQQSMTGMAAAGAHMILFSTGRGNPSGTPVTPVIKITGNPETIDNVPEHIDVDISSSLTGTLSDEGARDKIIEEMYSVADGKPVSAEILGHREVGIKRVGQSIL